MKSWRRLKISTKFFIVSIVFGAVVAPLAYNAIASAQFSCGNTIIWGRKECINYISGTVHQTSIPPFHNNFFVGKNKYNLSWDRVLFEKEIEDRLLNGDTMDQVSAAITIDIMLGKPGGFFGGSRSAAINYAKANLNEWKQLVDTYEAAGKIDWDSGDNGWCVSKDYPNASYDDAGGNEDIFHQTDPPECIRVITFSRLNGQTGTPFRIQYGCGNPIGEANLQVSNPPTGDINPPTPPNGSNPPGYMPPTNANVTLQSSCQNITGHAFDPTNPAYAVKVNLSYSIGGGPPVVDQATASTSGTHLYSRTTPAAVSGSIMPVSVTAVGIDSTGATFPISGSPITIGPCLLPNPVCDGFTIAPTSLDPDTKFTITASVNYNDASIRANVLAQPNTKFFVTINGPGVNRTIVSTSIVQLQAYGVGGIRFATPLQNQTGQTGVYAVGWGITGSFGAVNCGDAIPTNSVPPPPPPPTFTVSKKPYFKVDGGDISAGAGMTTGGVDCAAAGGLGDNSKASVVSWNKGTAGAYGGAGTVYAALAINHLQDFATGQGSAISPDGAAFGNTGGDAQQVALASGLFGGEFASTTACTADYFANATAVQSGPKTYGSIVLAKGEHRTIYVDGDVYINGNITFGPLGVGYTYANTSEIPSFSLVAKGNIYIDPGVQQLDGFYIAQPDNATSYNGIIYTCAPAGFGTNAGVLSASLQAQCDTALTVNGSFTGRQIWLLRTAGSISTTPAETFNYMPELWLSTPFGNGLSPATTDDYDAITSLPPVL